jgi:tetratricopeptide (TPR) repeat protein
MKKRRIAAVSVAGLFAVALAGRDGRAEPSPADKSLATALFQQGRALLEQGRIAEACRKLEESQRLDPGGGTLLNLALCHEHEGRTATAWAEFTEAIGFARRDGRTQRVEIAETHIEQLEPKLCRMEIVVPSAADVPGLEVLRDGSPIGRAAWGAPMPIDPG